MPNGSPPDDKVISDDDLLYRRITIEQVKRDRQTGRILRLGSNAFDDSNDGDPCSVHLGSKLVEAGLEPASILIGNEHRCGLAEVTVRDVRELGYGVLFAPLVDWPAHASLTGDKGNPRRQRDLARAARIVIDPPGS